MAETVTLWLVGCQSSGSCGATVSFWTPIRKGQTIHCPYCHQQVKVTDNNYWSIQVKKEKPA